MDDSVKLYNIKFKQIISYFDSLESKEEILFSAIEKLEDKPAQSIVEPLSYASKLLLDELKEIKNIKKEIMNSLVTSESELFAKIALI